MAFWSESEPVARKPHRCDECGQPIEPGQRYNRGAGINVYREFGVWNSHCECRALALELRRLGDYLDDEWPTISEGVWELDGPGLAWLQMDHPLVYERFRAELEEHERKPVHYVWSGFDRSARLRPYRWESLA